jgi:hypothetical protein
MIFDSKQLVDFVHAESSADTKLTPMFFEYIGASFKSDNMWNKIGITDAEKQNTVLIIKGWPFGIQVDIKLRGSHFPTVTMNRDDIKAKLPLILNNFEEP